jgi:hypothetical protein
VCGVRRQARRHFAAVTPFTRTPLAFLVFKMTLSVRPTPPRAAPGRASRPPRTRALHAAPAAHSRQGARTRRRSRGASAAAALGAAARGTARARTRRARARTRRPRLMANAHAWAPPPPAGAKECCTPPCHDGRPCYLPECADPIGVCHRKMQRRCPGPFADYAPLKAVDVTSRYAGSDAGSDASRPASRASARGGAGHTSNKLFGYDDPTGATGAVSAMGGAALTMTEGAFAATGGALSSMATALTTLPPGAWGGGREAHESFGCVVRFCLFSGRLLTARVESQPARARATLPPPLTRALPPFVTTRQAAPCAATCRRRRGPGCC